MFSIAVIQIDTLIVTIYLYLFYFSEDKRKRHKIRRFRENYFSHECVCAPAGYVHANVRVCVYARVYVYLCV